MLLFCCDIQLRYARLLLDQLFKRLELQVRLYQGYPQTSAVINQQHFLQKIPVMSHFLSTTMTRCREANVCSHCREEDILVDEEEIDTYSDILLC